MDGSKLPSGIQPTPVSPQVATPDIGEAQEARHSSRQNRFIKAIKNVLKKLPGRGNRELRNIPIEQRQITAFSQPVPKMMSGNIQSQAQEKDIFREVGDVFAEVKMGKGDSPEVQRAYRQARNQFERAAISVAQDVLIEARLQSDGGELILAMKEFIEQHEQKIHQNYEPVTEKMVEDLRKLPGKLLSELSLRNVDREVAREVLKVHLNESRESQTLSDHNQIPVSDSEAVVPGSTHDHKELFKLQKLQFDSAREVLKNESQSALREGRTEDAERLTKLDRQLLNELRRLQQTVQLKGDEPVNREEMRKAKEHYPKILQDALVSAGVDKQTVARDFEEALIDQLNFRPWKTIEKSFSQAGVEFASRQQPAAEIKVPESLRGEVSRLYETDYAGYGVSGIDSTNTYHATNLNRSDFSINNSNVYTGIRHGIADPYGVDWDPDLKAEGGKVKAREILLSALATRPDIFEQALIASQGGPVPTLAMTSTSMVTTGLGSGKERKMQKAQNEAFNYFTDPAKQPITMELPGSDGQSRTIKLNFKQARFNIPVNWGGVGSASLVTGGRSFQKKMNDPAMGMLVGKPGKGSIPGGMAGEFLSGTSKKGEEIRTQIRDAEEAGNGEKVSELNAQLDQLTRHDRSVMDLTTQIKAIYKKGSHYHHHHDAYKLATRVALLTHMVGAVPLSNCKSGKDRTGMLDAEIKFLAARINPETGEVPEPGPIVDPADRALFQTILQESGNLEVQEQNVGVRGYKTEWVESITERVGDPAIREEIRGLSKSVH
ncbi:inositol phosphate phosphatase SopB [Endozoicomonas sp. 8E]|uniref:inositol phosphate phosphatase SopB n=1 Tax=Endozoicomonas sp. 8E TaxID=3035692 RepID=UPI002938E107|nr:inositol phosphate phosphatase SopB [Endozoicomonas sp. 8E]WOG26471.1 inositol phosphate phosphatase SopB [Endozoicomonas sp. 8E]